MKVLAIAALAAALSTNAVAAPAATMNTVVLDDPLAGATLSSGAITMSIYFTEAAGDAFEVVVTYLDDAAQDQPRRIVLALSDGENLRFGLPGHQGKLYEFGRNGDAVTISEATAHPASSASPEI